MLIFETLKQTPSTEIITLQKLIDESDLTPPKVQTFKSEKALYKDVTKQLLDLTSLIESENIKQHIKQELVEITALCLDISNTYSRKEYNQNITQHEFKYTDDTPELLTQFYSGTPTLSKISKIHPVEHKIDMKEQKPLQRQKMMLTTLSELVISSAEISNMATKRIIQQEIVKIATTIDNSYTTTSFFSLNINTKNGLKDIEIKII